MASRMASCDVYRIPSLFSCVSNSEPRVSCQVPRFVIVKPFGADLDLILCIVLWTLLCLSFNAYVYPLCVIQVIYRTLTRQPTTGWYFSVA
jgi:hypothetical protein